MKTESENFRYVSVSFGEISRELIFAAERTRECQRLCKMLCRKKYAAEYWSKEYSAINSFKSTDRLAGQEKSRIARSVVRHVIKVLRFGSRLTKV